MDIQKEREAFEETMMQMTDGHFNATKNHLTGHYTFGVNQTFWAVWQAAKAQDDQKIKILLCDDHLKKCESPTGIFNSQYPDEEPCLICLAKQAKAQAVPEGFVLVEKKNTEDWYLDDCEGMWWDHDGIDGSLCELDIGEVQAVEHKEYLITENNTLYAARVWDDANDQVDCWQFFKTKEEAEKAAAYCKAKFYEEAQEPTND